MSDSSQQTGDHVEPVCPVGEVSCQWLDELGRLRVRITELNELVSVDELTGLYNLRYFRSLLKSEMQRCKRSGIPLSLVVVDIDHFKRVNDTHGHESGNLALQHVARLLRLGLRSSDIVCRYGGEEFVLVFPETLLPIAIEVAERIRLSIEDSVVTLNDGTELQLTVSMGANVFNHTDILEPEQFVDLADRYLYEAKQAGRNCIRYPDFVHMREDSEVTNDERAMLVGD